MGRNHFDAKSGQMDPSPPSPPPPPPLPSSPHPAAETGLARTCSAPLLPPYRYVALTLLPGPAHTLYCIVQPSEPDSGFAMLSVAGAVVFRDRFSRCPPNSRFEWLGVQNSCPVRQPPIVMSDRVASTLLMPPPVKGRVGDVWDQMCRFLGHPDPNPFGLAIHLENEYMFLENDAKLAKYAPKSWRTSSRYGLDGQGKPLLSLHLRIQYYLDWHFLSRDRVVREHYYHQVRKNVLRQAIGDWCWNNEARYFLLAAYALQADVGPAGSDFFDPACYFPQKVLSRVGIQYVRENIPKIHKDSSVATLSRGQAQLEFLHEASVPPAPHNMALYKLWAGKPPSASIVHVGLSTNGLTILQELNDKDKCDIVAQLTWPSIAKLSFEKRKFEVRVNDGSRYTYWAKSERKANLLLSHCRRTHQFSMTLQARFPHLLAVPGTRDKFVPCDTLKKLGIVKKDDNVGGNSRNNGNDQRVSVISSASSNTTSGIVTDSRIHSQGNSEDEMDLDIICGSVESLGLGRDQFSCCSDCVDCHPYNTAGKSETSSRWNSAGRCGKRKNRSRDCSQLRGHVLLYLGAKGSNCENSSLSIASPQVPTDKNTSDCKGADLSCDEYLIKPKETPGSETRSPTDNYVDFFDLYEFNEFQDEESPQNVDLKTSGKEEIKLEEPKEVNVKQEQEDKVLEQDDPDAPEEFVIDEKLDLADTPEDKAWQYPLPRYMETSRSPPPPLPPKSGPRKSSLSSSSSSWLLFKSLRRVAKRVTQTQAQDKAEEAVFISSKTKINVLTAHTTSVSSAFPSFARPTIVSSKSGSTCCAQQNWSSLPPPPPIPTLPHPPPPPPPPQPPTTSCDNLPFVGVNNYLNVHASTLQMDWFTSLSTRNKLKQKSYASTCASTPCLLESNQSQMSEFQAQLCSDVDYVIYPDKDPELSRQEYMDAKCASRIALEAQQGNCACCYSTSSAGGGVYQSLSAGSTTYGSLTYQTVPCYGYHMHPVPAGASDSGYGPSSGRHSLSLSSSCYAPAANSDTYYEAIQARPNRLTRILGANGHGTAHSLQPYQSVGGKASSDTYETIRPPLHYGTACSLAQKAQSTDNLAGPDSKPNLQQQNTGPLGLSVMDMTRLEEHSKSGDLPLISALLTSFQRSSTSGATPAKPAAPATSSAPAPRPPDQAKSKFPAGPANRPLPPLPPPPPPVQRSVVPPSSRKSHSLLLPFAKYGKNSYNITPSRQKQPITMEARPQQPAPPVPNFHTLPTQAPPGCGTTRVQSMPRNRAT
ncbi:unnamed protein product [Notodromas monacha]|uniref:FERM domain-containing protein n=1 Tax=Notodromas monacha TaxID=399045 RepID=A0A7R9BBK0_9CRUS|nr:unnamed protein product [Notodromas monacha]CAG0912282.1 unnamed protein product [Notodromas monacha]